MFSIQTTYLNDSFIFRGPGKKYNTGKDFLSISKQKTKELAQEQVDLKNQ